MDNSFRIAIIIFTIITNIVFGWLVSTRSVKSKAIGKLLLLLCIFIPLWTISNYYYDQKIPYLLSLLANRLVFTFTAPLLALLVHLAITFPGNNILSKKIAVPLYLLVLIFVPLSFTDFIVKDVDNTTGIIRPVFNYGAALFGIYSILMCIIAIIKFRSNFAKAKSIQKQQMQYFTIGISLTAFIALLTNLIFPMFLNIFSLTDLGPASSLIFIGFTTLAIIRYRLFDVKFLFGKLIYYLLIAFLPYISFYIFYFLLNGFSYKGGVVFYLFGIPASVFFLLIYDRMHNYISNFTDNRFIHPDYNPLKIIEQYRKDTTNKLEKNDIIETTLAYIAKTIRPELQGIIIAKDNDTIEITNYKNTQTDIEINQLKELFDYYGSTNNQALIYDEFQSPNSLALKIKRTLKRHKIKLALPLVLKNTAVGIIFLGMKEADYPYSTEEINFISILTNSLIQNLNRADIFEEAKRFNIELKQKVKEATTKLEKAYKQLKVLDEAKSDFISIASHQLRTPLSIIKGYLSMITEGDYGKINAEQLRVIEMSFNAVSDLSEIVNELLTSSRIERGKFTIDKTPVDIIELLNYVFKLYQNKYDKKGLSLKLITPKHQTKLIFNIDREKFEQVIVNLIENAYNYTPQGGVTVTLEEKKTSVILAVKDTGIGIPPEGKKKLFERFSRLDNAQNLRPDGTGIGLFTAKVIVEKHDGKIWFDSELGKGTTFFVEIPKA